MSALQRILEGLKIFAKYNGPGAHSIAVGHDIIYAGSGISFKHHREKLRELGWDWYEDLACWGFFV